MEDNEVEDMVAAAMDSNSPTDTPFFKANLTLSKFFNVSVPIEDKFNFKFTFDKNNLTEQVNQLDLLPPIHPSTNFALFLCSLVFAMFWVCFLNFNFNFPPLYNSSVSFLCLLPLSSSSISFLLPSLTTTVSFLPLPQITYITFFNSRVVGALATRVANNFLHLFVSGSYVKVMQVAILVCLSI